MIETAVNVGTVTGEFVPTRVVGTSTYPSHTILKHTIEVVIREEPKAIVVSSYVSYDIINDRIWFFANANKFLASKVNNEP
jgi:hypothetical protein